MKVAMYSEYFFPISGGVQTNIFELASGFSDRRQGRRAEPIDVTVITRTSTTTAEDRSWPFRLVRRPSFARLVRLLRTADVIHVAGPAMLPMAIGFALRKPIVIEHHGYQAICPNGILLLGTNRSICPGYFMAGEYGQCLRCNSDDFGWFSSMRALLLQFARRRLCKLASVNIAITNHVARRVALPRTQTILYGARDLGCTRTSQQGDLVEIGYVGRLVPEKGVPVLLKAAKRLQNDGLRFRLAIIGDGPLRKALEDETRGLGLESCVSFAGELVGAELERAVRPLQIVVMPSMWEETAGLSAIEQMMRGQVVVASDIGGLSEVVADAGLRITPGDPEALYTGLRTVLERPSLAESLRSAARDRAQNVFNLQTMIEKHIAVYRTLVRANKGEKRRA